MKHLYDDWDAVVGRAKGLWAPRWRTASHGAIQAAADNDADEAAPGTEGATAAIRDDDDDDAAAAATAAVADKTSPTIGGKALVQGKVDPTATKEACAAPRSPDVDDEWGGLGSPPPATAAGGRDVSAEGDVKAPASGAQGDGAGESKSKGRWARAGWSTVDVRAVQSRLSRIVDDTSARIRSNIVVKVSGHLWEDIYGRIFLHSSPAVGRKRTDLLYIARCEVVLWKCYCPWPRQLLLVDLLRPATRS